MALQRRFTRVGGSLCITVPRDIAEAMDVHEGTPARLTLVGRQMVVEPQDDTMSDASFRRSFAAVLRKYGPAFKALADHDSGKKKIVPGRWR